MVHDSDKVSLSEQLKQRTKQFAVRVIQMYRALPKAKEAEVIGHQVLRSATGAAANYRAACRARSHAEFAAKMGIVVEEIDETVFWLELLVETDIVPEKRMQDLLAETHELLAVFAASQRTARTKKPQ